MNKYNLTRYEVGDVVLLGKDPNGYPHIQATIMAKIPKHIKVRLINNSYFGKPNIQWLSADEWWVVQKIK